MRSADTHTRQHVYMYPLAGSNLSCHTRRQSPPHFFPRKRADDGSPSLAVSVLPLDDSRCVCLCACATTQTASQQALVVPLIDTQRQRQHACSHLRLDHQATVTHTSSCTSTSTVTVDLSLSLSSIRVSGGDCFAKGIGSERRARDAGGKERGSEGEGRGYAVAHPPGVCMTQRGRSCRRGTGSSGGSRGQDSRSRCC